MLAIIELLFTMLPEFTIEPLSVSEPILPLFTILLLLIIESAITLLLVLLVKVPLLVNVPTSIDAAIFPSPLLLKVPPASTSIAF